MKTLRQAVNDYLSLRRSLGFKLKKHEPCLREFVSFLKTKRAARVSIALALQFATQHRHQQPVEWAARLRVVRGSPATGAAMISPPRYLHSDSCLTVPCVHDLICTRKKRSDIC